MAFQWILFIFIFIKFTMAEQNFWGNDECQSSSDCSGLTECDKNFGCIPSFWKVFVVMLSVFVMLCGLIGLMTYCCKIRRGNAVVRLTSTTTIITSSNPYQSREQMNNTQACNNIVFVEDVPPPYSEVIKNKQDCSPASIHQFGIKKE